ncbi:hypothetical protein OHC33_009202 [Knufia fluminis]|uniref:Transmembrane protein n=1 Tax=Knufia fluminis TaxID=191047 RepID=A0AAN8EQA9_9EURO|nr:hypothetical protein OHC33_009202 [Knufia fluminis]
MLQALGTQHLPFGDLTSVYQVRDISLLWSLNFWGMLSSKHFRTWKGILQAATFIVISILMACVGPAGAVAMIPGVIEYPTASRLVLVGNPELFFPPRVQLLNGTLTNGETVRSYFDQISSLANLETGDSRFEISNSDGVRALAASSNTAGNVTNFTATLSSLSTMQAFLTSERRSKANNSWAMADSLQPYVQLACTSNYNMDTSHLSFSKNNENLNNLFKYEDLPLNASDGISAHGFPFVAFKDGWTSNITGVSDLTVVSNLLTVLKPSMTAYNQSLIIIAATHVSYEPEKSIWIQADACTLSAYWKQARIYYTVESSTFQSRLPLDTKLHENGVPIYIDLDWARSIIGLFQTDQSGTLSSLPSTKTLSTIFTLALAGVTNESGVAWYFEDFSTASAHLTAEQIGSLKSLIRINATSEDEYDDVIVTYSMNWTDLSTTAHYTINAFKTGYGYDSNESTVRISIAVLATYLLVVMVYCCSLVMHGKIPDGWKSVGELVMLALHSQRPSHVEGTSVGVHTIAIYQKPVGIRVGREDTAELVFLDDPTVKDDSYALIEPNRKY